MKPVRTRWTKNVYHGPPGEDTTIGDLWCHIPQAGEVVSVWRPDEEELMKLNGGGAVILSVLMDPPPPVMLVVGDADETEAVADHGFKVPLELEERERDNA